MKRFCFFILPVLLQSCSSMYIPAVRSIPLLDKKGEFQGEAGVSTNSVYANASYALSKNIALSINGNLSYRNFSDKYDLFTGGHLFGAVWGGEFEHRYVEASLGKINILAPSGKLKLEIFGGIGHGLAKDFTSKYGYDRTYRCDYYSFFGQGNWGVKIKVVEAGASLRLAYSQFDYNTNSFDLQSSYQNEFDAIHFQPMGFVRVGKGNLKAVFRAGINYAWTIPSIEDISLSQYRGFDASGKWEYTAFHFSIGLSYRIGGKKIDTNYYEIKK